MTITLKRAYDPPDDTDGQRILIDRVWPRGLKKEALGLDDWTEELAPSTALRKWFGHDPAKWDEFRQRYFRELDANADAVERLRRKADDGAVTLVYSARDRDHNNAVALSQYLQRRKS